LTSSVTCTLNPGRYTVTNQLNIFCSNCTITGGGGPGNTILVRGDPSLSTMMFATGYAANVTISNMTFDGNRYGFGINNAGNSCLPGNYGIWDLNVSNSGGAITVEWLDFINAPGTALEISGNGSSVSVSNFGQGGLTGWAPDGTYRSESGPESATRSTAVLIDGSSNGAWYNAISYAGTAGITLNGSNQYAYGNWLIQNRYEISDGLGGPTYG